MIFRALGIAAVLGFLLSVVASLADALHPSPYLNLAILGLIGGLAVLVLAGVGAPRPAVHAQRSPLWLRAGLLAVALTAALLAQRSGLAPGAGQAVREQALRPELPAMAAAFNGAALAVAHDDAALRQQLPPVGRAVCGHVWVERAPAGGVIGHCAVSRELTYVYDPRTRLEAVQIDTGIRERREPWAPGWYRLWQ